MQIGIFPFDITECCFTPVENLTPKSAHKKLWYLQTALRRAGLFISVCKGLINHHVFLLRKWGRNGLKQHCYSLEESCRAQWRDGIRILVSPRLFRGYTFVISAIVVKCSLLHFSLVVACGVGEWAFCWGGRLGNSSVPDPLYHFGKLQCYRVLQFLHQHAPSKLHFLFPLSFSFWKAGLL